MDAIERDWAGLLPELVQIIAGKIVDIFDFIRFRAACKTWRSITTMSQFFPWILSRRYGPGLRFYSIAFEKSFTIPAPKCANKDFFSPCCGTMLVQSGTRHFLSLINPLNNGNVSLPLIINSDLEWIGSRSFQKGDHVVLKGSDNRLHVLMPGGIRWIPMEGESQSTYFYSNNLLYIVNTLFWNTKVINLNTRETVFVVPPPSDIATLPTGGIDFTIWRPPTLIESSREILHVTYAYELKKFVIHRLEVGNGKGNPHWVEVRNIGDRMLFIDFHHNGGAFSLRATDICGSNFKGNCIYFIRIQKNLPSNYRCSYAVERYDIESTTTECIYIQDGYITWYLPDFCKPHV
ncbi:hypothetical protein LUZ62_040682 [Rhynchospora pubera]|uniref:KIB1-4 beta-propeller domain-containing protein n=1 Tax=Rhynchospora pubera TaxID=906938 RepID=A0AAV8FEB3_9POAL|nr:hypothetical protein LUZ62_040682 [Rhynchospora pubera]